MKRMARRMMAGTLAMLLLAGQWTAAAGRAAEGVAGAGETVLETIIIDNDRTGAPNTPGEVPTTTKGFFQSGMSAGGYNALAYAGGTHNANNNTAYAMYTPSESGESFVIGTYRVSVWIFQRASTEALLLTEVYRNGEAARASFPNKAPAGGWVDLGVFDFQGSGTEYVKLSRDPTGPTGYFNADSVRFERLPSRISSLRDLSVGGSSVYRPGVTEFTYNAGYETSFITLTPTAADPKAVVEVNGAVLEQGQTSGPIPLEIGDNWIPVDVTAENPDYSQRYMVKVKRSSGTSTDADLSGVLLDGGELTGFDPTVTSYTYTVPHNTAAVSVAPIPSHPQATVKVNGTEAGGADMPVAVPLNEGANEVRIEVIAQDPAYTKTYALNVIRQKADATLKRLLIDGAQPTRGYQVGGGQNQSPGFEPDVTDYVHAAPVGAESVVISAEPGDMNAEVRINGASLGEGKESYTAAIPVGPGLQAVQIEVLAEDRSYSGTYNLTIGQGDHARGKPARASQEYYLTPGKHAVDGDGSTVWRNVLADGTPYVWLEADLLRQTSFDRAVLAFYNYADMKNFKLQYSDDGMLWQDAYVKEGTPSPLEVIAFPEVTARFVRFYAEKAEDLVFVGLYAMELYGSSLPSDEPGEEYERLSGIALSKGSLAFDPYTADYTVVADGDLSVAAVRGVEGQTIEIDGAARDSLLVSKESLYGKARTVAIRAISPDGSQTMEYRLHIELVPSVPGSGYTLAFEDEFEGGSLDEDRWFYRTGGNSYSDNKKENVSVSDGYLRLALKKEPAGGGKPYSGGGVITKELLGYGYYETRFKQWNKAGFHSSFWIAGMNQRVSVLDGDTLYSPPTDYQVNEIDGFEIETSAPDEILTAAHYWWPGDTHLVYVPYTTYTGVDSSDDYHTYGFEWTPTKLKYYIDGQLFREEYYPGPHGAGTQGRGQHLWLTSLVYKLPVDEEGLPAEVTYDYFKYYTKDYGLDAPEGAVLVDNGDSGYSETGTWASAGEAFGYGDTDTRYTRNPGDRAEWTAALEQEGSYEVRIWNPSFHNNTTQAKVTVRHAEGDTELTVDQKLGGQQWISLGAYRFTAGTDAKVILTAMDTAYHRADAVLFVPLPGEPGGDGEGEEPGSGNEGEGPGTNNGQVSGGSSGEISGGGAVNPVIDSDGAASLSIAPALDGAVASAELSAAALRQAREAAVTADALQLPRVRLRIAGLPGAEAYEIRLPGGATAGGADAVQLEIATELGSIMLPSDLLPGANPADTLKLTLARADRSAWSHEAKEAAGTRPALDIALAVNDKPLDWKNNRSPVLLSIPYTPTAEEAVNHEHLTVWLIGDGGIPAPVTSGKYDPETGMVTFAAAHFGTYAVVYVMKEFRDLDGMPWARKAVEVLAAKGIVQGTAPRTYSPEAGITRAEYATLLARTLGLFSEGSGTGTGLRFADVRPDDYFSAAVTALSEAGVLQGYEDGTFRPEERIKREELAALTERALLAAQKPLKSGDTSLLDGYADSADIAAYARGSFTRLIVAGLLTGDQYGLRPAEGATRGEAAVLLYRIYSGGTE